ncbi:hypothetical protein KM043_013051 [Ampulex compressa]|nr:hypothetical protein KM043_013051 [Ampulex compressa]
MKDFAMIWSRLAGRQYSSNNRNVTSDDSSDCEETTIPRNSQRQRKSSIVVNRFFKASLPVHSIDSARWPKSIFTLMTLGLLGLAIGCFVLVCQPYDFLFKLKVIFGEGGEIFEIWRKPEVDLYLKVYLFNVTNHEAYLSGKEDKLRFQEIGPYVYKEAMEHGNIRFNDNGTVSAIPLHPLKYIPEMSNGTEEDLLILPNIALLSITDVMKDATYITRWGLNVLIRQTDAHPLVEMTAREFMFGYKSTLVTLGNHLMPSWIKFDKLGLIDRMYDFDGDFETVYTGEDDVRMTGLIDKYNGDVNLPQWPGKCGNVNGASDGAKFKSYIEPNETLLFFRKSLCRSKRMYRTGDRITKGLYTYEYKFVENEMDNGAFNPENKCFCREGRCLAPGLIDVRDCYYGFPIALSYPHFYKADPSLLASVEGLEPRAEAHESYFYIQPKSGLPADLAFRFQINMALQKIGHMARVEKFSDVTLPLLWFEIGMHELPDSLNSRFWLYLNALPMVQEVAIYFLFVLGSFFLVWSVTKILLHQPNASSSRRGQWLEIDIQKKRMKFMNEKAPARGEETDTCYNTLLVQKGEPTRPCSPIKREIV